jgi:hypothetical protein
MLRFLKKIEYFLFSENYSRIPFISWIAPLFIIAIHAVLFFNKFEITPYTLVYSIFALIASTRWHLRGLILSIFGLVTLSFLLKNAIPMNAVPLYLASLIAMGGTYMIQAFISEIYEEYLVNQSKEACMARDDQKLWKSRFENAQIKFEKDKESFERSETEFQRKEDEFIETVSSMKQLLGISHRENQKILSQNDRLIEEMRELSSMSSKAQVLEQELLNVRAELNEARVQLYQDRLLYQNLREKQEALAIPSPESLGVQAIHLEHMPAPPKEEDNIYLNLG